MFIFEKRTQIPVVIKNRNPKLASYILSQYGGPDGELGAALRYLSQRFAQTDKRAIATLTDMVYRFRNDPVKLQNQILSFN